MTYFKLVLHHLTTLDDPGLSPLGEELSLHLRAGNLAVARAKFPPMVLKDSPEPFPLYSVSWERGIILKTAFAPLTQREIPNALSSFDKTISDLFQCPRFYESRLYRL